MESSNGELFEAHTLILNQTLSYIGGMSLKCAVELGIADIMESHGRPMSHSELARSIPIPPEKHPMLRRIMRLLVARGIFSATQSNPGGDGEKEAVYSLTPFSRLLPRRGVNMSAYVLVPLDQALVQPALFTSAWLRTEDGPSPCELAHGGRRIWELINGRPELNDMFNGAMASNARLVVREVVSERPDVFRGLKTLVDVGGGTGTAARTIAEAFPELKCTVFDLPHVVATVPESKAAVDAVGGDMFEYIPPADAVFLKSVLHDWEDDECVKILKRCMEAIPPREEGGKVIIVDTVVNSRPDNPTVTETQLFYDVFMMVGSGGKEREEHEWKKLFDDAGFQGYKIFPLLGRLVLIKSVVTSLHLLFPWPPLDSDRTGDALFLMVQSLEQGMHLLNWDECVLLRNPGGWISTGFLK